MATGIEAVTYAAPNSRMRGLYAQLLSRGTWLELLHADSVGGAIVILRETDYRNEVDSYGRGGNLEQVENALSGRAAFNIRRAMGLVQGAVRDLLQVWWQHYELENLKSVFRGVEQHLAPEITRRLLVPLGEYTTLPWDSLMQEQSVGSLIERLNTTHYINPLRNATAAYQREHSLFPLEIALDIRYYRDIANAIRRLKGDEQAEARRVLGVRLDILNILWAFRHRIFYGLSAEEIVNYTLWRTFRTNIDLVREIALGADPRDILRRVWGDKIDQSLLGTTTNPIQTLPLLELTLERFWRNLALREMGGYPFKLGALLGYIVLSELEIRDLITLLESKGMGWPPERIVSNLIRGKE